MYNKEELLNLLELNKIDSKYAEITNIIIYILGIIIFIILTNYITVIEALSFFCSYYIITKFLNYILFGTRLKRIKERQSIKNSIKNLKLEN